MVRALPDLKRAQYLQDWHDRSDNDFGPGCRFQSIASQVLYDIWRSGRRRFERTWKRCLMKASCISDIRLASKHVQYALLRNLGHLASAYQRQMDEVNFAGKTTSPYTSKTVTPLQEPSNISSESGLPSKFTSETDVTRMTITGDELPKAGSAVVSMKPVSTDRDDSLLQRRAHTFTYVTCRHHFCKRQQATTESSNLKRSR